MVHFEVQTSFRQYSQVLPIKKKSGFNQFNAYFCESHLLPDNSTCTAQCALILKFKTIFDRIRSVSHSIEDM